MSSRNGEITKTAIITDLACPLKFYQKYMCMPCSREKLDSVCLVGILWQSGDGGTNICYNIEVISNGISLGSPEEKEKGIKTDRNKLV